MIVDYGPNKIVCKIQLPAGFKSSGAPAPGVATKQNVDEVLEEVVPSASRGKELGRMNLAGMPEQVTTEYEHVYIGQFPTRELNGGRIIVIFKNSACPKYNPGSPGLLQ